MSDEWDEIDQDEYERAACPHEYISWHGSSAECQECGEIVNSPFYRR